MKQSNFALRLQPSLMDRARKMAKSEGVALNQLINVAVAQMIATHDAATYIADRAKRGNVQRALEILRKAGTDEPPREGDELPESWKRRKAASARKE
jgi:hypothetical protein